MVTPGHPCLPPVTARWLVPCPAWQVCLGPQGTVSTARLWEALDRRAWENSSRSNKKNPLSLGGARKRPRKAGTRARQRRKRHPPWRVPWRPVPGEPAAPGSVSWRGWPGAGAARHPGSPLTEETPGRQTSRRTAFRDCAPVSPELVGALLAPLAGLRARGQPREKCSGAAGCPPPEGLSLPVATSSRGGRMCSLL